MLRPHSSSSLARILQKTDNAILQEAKQKLAESGTRKRIFDGFPCLLPSRVIDQLQRKLDDLLQDIPSEIVIEADNGLQLNDAHSKRRIMSWEKQVIQIACAELLDKNDGIKKDILQLLQWDKELDSTEVFDVMCAYVGFINQIVMSRGVNVAPEIFGAVCAYITSHYGQWIKEVMARPTLSIPSYPLNDIQPGVGWGLLAVGIVAGVTLYSLANAERNNDRPPSPIPSPRKNQF